MRHRTSLLGLTCATLVGCNPAPPSSADGTEAGTETGTSTSTSGADTSDGGPGSSGGSTSASDSTGIDASSGSSSEGSSTGDTGSPCVDRDCTDPPAAACRDPFTVSTPAAAGTCVDDACHYEPALLDCPYGCDTAQCVCEPGAVCTDGTVAAATAWLTAEAVQQPRIASLGCSQVVAARATIAGLEQLHVWIVDHQGTVLDETALDVPGDRLDIAADHGVIALAWHDGGRVFGTLLDANLDPIATDIALSDAARDLRWPAIAPTSDGMGFVTVYYGEDGLGGFGLFAQAMDRVGTLVGSEHALGVASGSLLSGCYTYSDVATGEGGTLAVWTHCESGTRSVYAVPLDASGAAAAPGELVAMASAGSIAPSRVAVTGFGRDFAVTYNNDRISAIPNSGDVYVAMLDNAAQVLAGPENATAGTWGGGKFWSELAAGTDQLVLTWYSPETVPGDRRVLMSAIDPTTATPTGPVIDVSLETGTAPFFHHYPSPYVGPEGFGVIFPSADELWLVGLACPVAPAP